MASRKFVYDRDRRGVEITPFEERALCAEIAADVATRKESVLDCRPQTPRRRNATCWPIYSDTCGVNPDQIPQAQETLRRHGIYTEYCPHTGRAILRDKAHKRAMYQVTGHFDGDAGYGDATPIRYDGPLTYRKY